MNTYDVVVFVHVISAVLLVGGGILVTPALHRAIGGAWTVSDMRRWLTIGKPLGRINPISSITLLASGVYLSSVGEWWAAPWVQLAVALWVGNTVLAVALLKPAMSDLAEAAFVAESEPIGRRLHELRTRPRFTLTPHAMLANDLAVLFLMVTKPSGFVIPVIVLVVAHIATLGIGAGRRSASVDALVWTGSVAGRSDR